jgi:3-methyladenine DNA glycosylase/8-oxoguanine DNA glycosylase
MQIPGEGRRTAEVVVAYGHLEKEIASDLKIPNSSAKAYSKLARRASCDAYS